MLAREREEAVGGLWPCAAGSAHGVRSQQSSEKPEGTCVWVDGCGITRCCCLLAPASSAPGWDVRRGMQRWWAQRGTSVSSSVPTLGWGLGSCSPSGAFSGKLELEFCPTVKRRAPGLKTQGWWDLSTPETPGGLGRANHCFQPAGLLHEAWPAWHGTFPSLRQS